MYNHMYCNFNCNPYWIHSMCVYPVWITIEVAIHVVIHMLPLYMYVVCTSCIYPCTHQVLHQWKVAIGIVTFIYS